MLAAVLADDDWRRTRLPPVLGAAACTSPWSTWSLGPDRARSRLQALLKPAAPRQEHGPCRGGSTVHPVSMPWKTFELAGQNQRKKRKSFWTLAYHSAHISTINLSVHILTADTQGCRLQLYIPPWWIRVSSLRSYGNRGATSRELRCMTVHLLMSHDLMLIFRHASSLRGWHDPTYCLPRPPGNPDNAQRKILFNFALP